MCVCVTVCVCNCASACGLQELGAIALIGLCPSLEPPLTVEVCKRLRIPESELLARGAHVARVLDSVVAVVGRCDP